MKSELLVGLLMIFSPGMTLNASASEIDCFPMCAEPVKVEVEVEGNVDAWLEGGPGEGTVKSCDAGLLKQAEALNDKVKPIREIVGYVRSPQSLALKLVNDHVVKIPAWIGFAMDPVGSLKHMAIDEVRTRAKEAIGSGNSCGTAPAIAPFKETETRDAKHSI